MCGIFKYNLWLLWISDDPEYENVAILNFPLSWKTDNLKNKHDNNMSYHNSAFLWLKIIHNMIR